MELPEPHELWVVAEREGSPLGARAKVLKERLDWLADEHEVEMHVDKPQADVLVTFSSIEIMKYPQSLVSLGVDLRETRDAGDLNFCCGGGGGVVTTHRADELRYKAFEIKMRQIDATGAEVPVGRWT
jgi:hypothetical protein